ncbi:hypothetical protein EON82_24075, partial [bacterium]
GKEGKRERGKEGKRERGKEGKRERGKEGKRERGKEDADVAERRMSFAEELRRRARRSYHLTGFTCRFVNPSPFLKA